MITIVQLDRQANRRRMPPPCQRHRNKRKDPPRGGRRGHYNRHSDG